MKNKEKFAKEIIDLGIKNKAIAVDKYTHNVVPCEGFECCDCLLDSGGYCDDNRSKWAEEEYVELHIDWSKVPVDTPILVRDSGDDKWGKRYFAKCENDKIYAWSDGCTSWSADDKDYVTDWKYAKLAEMEDSE